MLGVVFVGSIDHGKSTLIGRLLYDTNSLPKEKIEEVKKACEALGKEFEFAYILDALEEERKDQITIDMAQTFFSWKGKEYCIIDAPGHKEFLKNMLTGATQANAAVLIVSAKDGIEEQTKRHAFLLKLVGIEKVIVAVNKMDLVNYSQKVFEKVKRELKNYFSSLGIKACFVPISALKGDNVARPSEKMSWYEGKTFLEILQEIEKEKRGLNDFRMCVQDVYEKNGEKIYLGNIASGEIKIHEEVKIFPGSKRDEVVKILIPQETRHAKFPKAIGIVLEKENLARGYVLAKATEPLEINELETWIFAIDKIENEKYDFCCSTQKVKCFVEIKEKIDLNNLASAKASVLENGDVGRVKIKLEKPVFMERFAVLPELGKFTIERENYTIGGGILV